MMMLQTLKLLISRDWRFRWQAHRIFDLIIFLSFFAVPLAPQIIPKDCSAENNSVTVAWQAPNHSFVQGYVLELDDGSGGEFRVSINAARLNDL
jgi:hypothetical protein